MLWSAELGCIKCVCLSLSVRVKNNIERKNVKQILYFEVVTELSYFDDNSKLQDVYDKLLFSMTVQSDCATSQMVILTKSWEQAHQTVKHHRHAPCNLLHSRPSTHPDCACCSCAWQQLYPVLIVCCGVHLFLFNLGVYLHQHNQCFHGIMKFPILWW